MSVVVQHRRDTRTNCEAATPAAGEFWFDTILKTMRAGDGAQLGGFLQKLWGRSKTISPAQITGNVNNYSPTDLAIAESLVLDADGNYNITGLAGGAADRELWLYNGTSDKRITLPDQSASSTAANRFSFIGGDLVLRPGQGVHLLYIAGSLNRWVAVGRADLGVTTLQDAVYLTGECRPAQVTSTQDNWDPADVSSSLAWSASRAGAIYFSTDASRNITGLAGGAKGRVAILQNNGSNPAVLQNANSNSTAGNRFDFGADVTLAAKQSAVLIYDSTASRWKLLAGPSSGGSGGPSDLEITLAQMAMAIADNANVAQFLGDSGNRFADSFDALTYVDTGTASNLNTGTAGALKPSTTSDTFTGTYNPSLTSNSTGFGGVMDRFVIAAAAFSTTGDRVRLTLTPPSTGNNTIISNIFIGPKGASAPNFDGTQVRVTFSGNNGVTLTAGGASVVSDDITFAFDHTKDHVVAVEYTGTSDVRGVFGGASNVTRYEKAGSGESGTTSVSGYSNNAGYLGVVDQIDVRTAAGTTNNVTVASTSLTAASAPSSARLAAMVAETDSITLNTDLVFSASRDGGTTYSNFTMTKKYAIGGVSIYESADLDLTAQPSGTSPRWKLASANNKNFEIRAINLYWK